MNTKQLGTIGELKAQYDFMKAGFDVSVPIGDYCAYDLIVIKDSKILKIQVKSCEKIIDGRMKFDLTSRNYYIDKKYDIQDCDYFYFYCLENEQSYLYKNTENNNSRAVYIRIEPTKNNQTKGINFAEDFNFNKVVNQL